MNKPYEVIKLLRKITRVLLQLVFWLIIFVFLEGDQYIVHALSYFDFFANFIKTRNNSMKILSNEPIALFIFPTIIIFFILRIIIATTLKKANIQRLQNFGHRLQVKVEDIERRTYGKDRNSYRNIIFKSWNEIFEERLRKNPFGYLDFWDSFEVLIDIEERENFHINLENIFDKPINKERMQIEKWKEKEWFTLEE